MRALLLTFCLLIASTAIGSGSNTVFQKVNQYWVTSNLSDFYDSSYVGRYLESLNTQIFLIKVSPEAWLQTANLLVQGNRVFIQFGNNSPIEFYYEPQLDLLFGLTRQGDLLILDPCEDYYAYYRGFRHLPQ